MLIFHNIREIVKTAVRVRDWGAAPRVSRTTKVEWQLAFIQVEIVVMGLLHILCYVYYINIS